ncbi:hypothetical protein M408DRAFT_28000 [Serendipita vermifera MAFF 305830]|uniref:Uncharacterized protein n=1 Tax=Serendipita vermifera MAFF 305830 TaxID=933852 RepID=A0A0C3AF79_SERVB|nr:hypothetical protein M408DRAFT_28000 [Serendipita vermifera MAFF 305830]
METALQNYKLPSVVQRLVEAQIQAYNAQCLMPILTAALQLTITGILMSPKVSRTSPYWPGRIILPLSTFGVLCSFVSSVTAVVYLQNICWLEITTRGIIMNNASSLPARIFLAGDNIPLYLLDPNNVALLLTEFGLPLDGLITAAVASYVFYVAALVFVITVGVLMYHNMYKTEWQRPYKEHLYVC